MEYTRSECARIFNISVDTLRYYESLGLLCPQRDGSGRTSIYTEKEILDLLEIRKIKHLGFANQEMPSLYDEQGNTSHMQYFSQAFKRAEAELREAQRKMAYIQQVKNVFAQVTGMLGTIQIGSLPERRFLILDRTEKDLAAKAMEGLPYLSYAYWIDRRCLTGEKPWEVHLAADVYQLNMYKPDLYQELMASGKTISNGTGMKVVRYMFCENIHQMEPRMFTPLLEYAHMHRFRTVGDVFGGLLGPEKMEGSRHSGYVITQTIQILEDDVG